MTSTSRAEDGTDVGEGEVAHQAEASEKEKVVQEEEPGVRIQESGARI